jgi:glyoxylase-like metal-dependent hydrolase (beta-lactamase superfamily II)
MDQGSNREIFLLELRQDIPGLEKGFIGCLVVPGPPTILVDVGPSYSAKELIHQLTKRGIKAVDYIWLTHIHIDHAGGTGDLLNYYPMAKAVCHEKGVEHLLEPSRLWEGSLKTLGVMAQKYGPFTRIPPDRLLPHKSFSLPGLEIIETPGHAPHHLSFLYQGTIFAGEAAGIYLPWLDPPYLRPATPPRFFFDTAIKSVDRLLGLGDFRIFYAHTGSHPSSREMLERYRQQLFFWMARIDEIQKKHSSEKEILRDCTETLLKEDPLLKGFARVSHPGTRERELYFIENSIKGFLGYLEDRAEKLKETLKGRFNLPEIVLNQLSLKEMDHFL